MSSSFDLSNINIEIEANADNAAKGLDELGNAMSRLKDNSKLTTAFNNLEKLKKAITDVSGAAGAAPGVESLAVALSKLNSLQSADNLKAVVSRIQAVAKLAPTLQTLNFGPIEQMAKSMEPLTALGKADGVKNVVTSLDKIPDLVKKLDPKVMQEFADKTQAVAAAIEPLTKSLAEFGKATTSLPLAMRQSTTALKSYMNYMKDATETSATLTAAQNLLKSALKKIGWAVFNKTLGEATANYNAFVEDVNLASVSLGDYGGQMSALAEKMQDVLGVDYTQAIRNMGLIQNLTTSFGMASDQAVILSKNLTQLGYDYASFYNIKTEDAFQKIQAAISGELEPIRRLGIDISKTRLQQEALNYGVTASVDTMSQADKALLRYVAIMKQSTNSMTDMARTLNSPANMMRVFEAQVTMLSRSLGALFIPMLNAVLPPLLAFVQAIREALTALAQFFGIPISFAELATDATVSLGGVEDGIDGVGSGATKAAKAVRTLIGGFDELNVMQTKTDSSSGSGSGGGGSLFDNVELPSYDMFENLVSSKVAEILDNIRGLLKVIGPLVAGIATAFALWQIPEIATKIAEIIKKAGGIVEVLRNIGYFALVAAGAAAYLWGMWDAVLNGVDLTNVLHILGGMAAVAAGLYLKFGAVAAGISLVVTGIGAFVVGIKDIIKNGANAANIVLTIGAAIGTFAGFVAAATGIGTVIFNVGMVLMQLIPSISAVGAAISELGLFIVSNPLFAGGIMAAITLAGFALIEFRSAAKEAGEEIYKASDAYAIYSKIIADSEANISWAAEAQETLTGKIQAFNDAMNSSDISFARSLIDDIYELSDSTETLTAYQMMELQTKVETLNGLGLEGLQLTIDETGTKVLEVRDDINQVIDALDKQAQMAALQEVLTEAYKQQYEAQSKLGQAQTEVLAAEEGLASSTEKLYGYYDNLNLVSKALAKAGLDKTYNALKMEMDDAKVATANAEEAFSGLYETMTGAQQTAETYLGIMTDMQGAFDGVGEAAKAVPDSIDKSFDFSATYARINGEMSENGVNMVKGLADGVKETVSVANDEVKALSDELQNTMMTENDMHSPSKVYMEYGGYLVEGLAQGISDNSSTAVQAITDVCNAMLDRLQSFGERFADGVNEIFDEFSSAMSSLETDGTTVSFSAMGRVNIPRLAKGGVLSGPSVVLAGEYANAKSDPEIVSPQHIMAATMEDVIAAVMADQTSVMYAGFDAIVDAINNKDTDVYIGDDAVGRANARYMRKNAIAKGVAY